MNGLPMNLCNAFVVCSVDCLAGPRARPRMRHLQFVRVAVRAVMRAGVPVGMRIAMPADDLHDPGAAMVTEYQTCWRTRYRSEVRQRMVTVYRDVPTTRTVQEEYTVMVPQTRTRTVAETINHPVYGDIQLRTTAMTPEVDVRQTTQTVTQMVAFQEARR